MAVSIAALLLCALAVNVSLSLKRENRDLKSRLQEITALKGEYHALKTTVVSFEARKPLIKVEGIVQAVDEVFRSLGLSRKVKSVKPMGLREKKFASEEEAEVVVEKVTMNEMINILYMIENTPMALSIKKTSIKTSFDSPTLLNLTLTVGLITPK